MSCADLLLSCRGVALTFGRGPTAVVAVHGADLDIRSGDRLTVVGPSGSGKSSGALVGEVLGAQSGLGLVIKTAQNNFDPDGVFATMLVISVIVLGAEWLIGKLEHRLLSWRPPAPTEANSL